MTLSHSASPISAPLLNPSILIIFSTFTFLLLHCHRPSTVHPTQSISYMTIRGILLIIIFIISLLILSRIYITGAPGWVPQSAKRPTFGLSSGRESGPQGLSGEMSWRQTVHSVQSLLKRLSLPLPLPRSNK